MTSPAITPPPVSTSEITHRSSRFRGASINLMYLPALLLFAIFIVYPFINGIVIATTNWDGYSPGRAGVGLANFTRLWSDPNFLVSLRNTFVYAFGCTILQQIFGLLLAVLVDSSIRGRNVARAIIYLPVLVSPVVMGTLYYLVFRYDQGALNDLLGAFGLSQVSWLSDSGFAVGVIVAINSLQFVGISMLIYLSGLQSIGSDVREAAALDGAVGFRQFRRITIPLLLPAFASSSVINLIGGFKLFDIIKVLTGGGPGYSTNSVSTFITTTYFSNQSAGYAAAQGVVLFILIAVFTLALNWWFDRRRAQLEG
ncbi:carbohydrate ABC transporter permease [Acidipropionibacterium virtanenii]|uniref:Lactose transport system permease protein LacF n=1 Tax=Acidipropionibacterium virtanenii TaxID=2057246 RepID=A0A344UXY0_9ACTN|nr:sugar ABC transporter permease [Acidipropionibacterium virtanenii]AXE40128.1 Lactose transport system permease protein LacF [Acidipropionibacterium virtanenii]